MNTDRGYPVLRILIYLAFYVISVWIILQISKYVKFSSDVSENDNIWLDKLFSNNDSPVLKSPDPFSFGLRLLKQDYPYSMFLEPGGEYQLLWGVDYINRTLRMVLKVREDSFENYKSSLNKSDDQKPWYWLGLGFSDYGDLKGADLALITRMETDDPNYVGQTAYQIIDAHVTLTDGIISSKEDQNWHLDGVIHNLNRKKLKSSRKIKLKQSFLYFMLSRKFDTCDQTTGSNENERHDYVLDRGTTHVILIQKSYIPIKLDQSLAENGLSEIPEGSLGEMKTHNSQNTTLVALSGASVKWSFNRVQLLKPDQVKSNESGEEIHNPSNTLTLDITFDKALIPVRETIYWSKLIKLPDYLKSKHHIIKFEKFDSAESESFVHHMLLYHCEIPADIEAPFYEGVSDGEQTPPLLRHCKKVIIAWAMGAEAFSYPPDVGYAIGGRNYSLFTVLEIHFHNPNLVKGIRDSSGFRIHLSAKVRKFEAGFLEVGYEYNPKLMIPPGMPNFLISGYCFSACTSKTFPVNGIKVFANQFHAHLRGAKIVARRVRNGVEGPPLIRDDHFNQAFQEWRLWPEITTIYPGDELIVTCSYDTETDTNITFGGYSISDEMCITYLMYYPKIGLERCRSSLSTAYLNEFFTNRNIKAKPLSDSSLDHVETLFADIRSNYETEYRTNISDIEKWYMFIDNGPHHVDCAKSDDTPLLEINEIRPQTIDVAYWEKSNDDCANG